ncbi:unnamed protein product, partial [Cylindrotheca closterium]
NDISFSKSGECRMMPDDVFNVSFQFISASFCYSFESSSVRFSIDNKKALFNQWGVERSTTVQEFPDTINDIIDCAFDTIAGEIYAKCPPSQSIASNAMSKSVFTDRPVRRRSDSGRIGIELSGLRSLFPSYRKMSNGQAMRITALMLCSKVSMNSSWERFEKAENHPADQSHNPYTRTVVAYFSTRSEALMASRTLQQLKICDKKHNYENIRIHCLSDGIPNDLQLDIRRRQVWNGLSRGSVDARRGICVLVQPTDFNTEQTPAAPVVDAIKNFQELAARASVQQLPLICISPRFLNYNDDIVHEIRRDQSGYQQSAVYGGIEPPKGPTPWIMRDFTPPSFCWVANAISLGKSPRANCKLTRIALWQSAMEEDHLWHAYACRECMEKTGMITTDYQYLASTRSTSGRPTKHLLTKLLEEYRPI